MAGSAASFLTGGFITLLLAAGMLTTGTLNTIFTKLQDVQVVKGTGDGPPTPFEHAFFQTLCMFCGEFLCMFVFFGTKIFALIKKRTTKQQEDDASGTAYDGAVEEKPKEPYLNPLIFWLPALCDLGGSTLLNIGLFLTYASVYQMLRGTLVVFTGFFSIVFLKHKLYYHHFAGILLIVLGTGVVGLTTVLYADPDAVNVARNPTLGNILVIAAQVLAATQFVVEEKFLSKYNAAPLQVVGWEGFFGACMSTIVLFVLYWIPGSDGHSMENAPYAIAQMFNSWKLMIFVLGSIFSIAFFNFFGVTIAKRVSSTSRSTIDSTRTMFVWAASMALGMESFKWLQIVGFVVLVIGSFMYNEVIVIPYYYDWYKNQKKLAEEKKKEKQIQQQEESESLQKKSYGKKQQYDE